MDVVCIDKETDIVSIINICWSQDDPVVLVADDAEQAVIMAPPVFHRLLFENCYLSCPALQH